MPATAAAISEADVLARAAAWPRAAELEQLTVSQLRELALAEGVDSAVAVLYDRIRKSPRHRPFIEAMENPHPPAWTRPRIPSTVVVVPPLYSEDHMDYPSSGMFVIRLAERLGFPTHWLPVPSMRTLAHGSGMVRDYLRRQSQPVILVSLSRSSSDVKMALAELSAEEQRRTIRAWLSVTGMLKGSPFINCLQDRWLTWTGFKLALWWQKIELQVFLDLLYGPGTPLWAPAQLADGVPAYHLQAFPLLRHYPPAITNKGERIWFRMARRLKVDRYGPHESAVALSDVLDEPGQVYPVWGVPHWIGPPWNIDQLLTRALQHIDLQ